MTRTARFKFTKQIGQVRYYGPGQGVLVGYCLSAKKQIGCWETYQTIAPLEGSTGYPKLDRPNVRRSTPKQQISRLKLIMGMAAWKKLTAAEREAWERQAEGKPRSGMNIFLSGYIMSLGFGRQKFGITKFGQAPEKIINYGWGIQPFGLSTFGSAAAFGLQGGVYSNTYGDKYKRAAAFGQTLFGRRAFGTPYHVKKSFGIGHQLFGCSSFGQLASAAWQYGLGWQYFGRSPFGSTLPGRYPGA